MEKFQQLLALAWRMQNMLQDYELDCGAFGDELVAIQQAAQQSVQRTCPKCGGAIIEGTPSHCLECKYAVASR